MIKCPGWIRNMHLFCSRAKQLFTVVEEDLQLRQSAVAYTWRRFQLLCGILNGLLCNTSPFLWRIRQPSLQDWLYMHIETIYRSLWGALASTSCHHPRHRMCSIIGHISPIFTVLLAIIDCLRPWIIYLSR